MAVTEGNVKRPRTKPAEIRRDELMDAAQRLFLEKGFASTSVAEIVKAADVAKGTFYLYFQTKEEILDALQERFIDGFCDRLDVAYAQSAGSDWPQRLDDWMAACVGFYLANVEFHDLVFHQFPLSRGQLQKANPIVDRLAVLLDAGRTDGVFDVDDSKMTAVMLFSAMHGAVDEAVADPAKKDRDRLFKSVKNLCLRAVVANRD